MIFIVSLNLLSCSRVGYESIYTPYGSDGNNGGEQGDHDPSDRDTGDYDQDNHDDHDQGDHDPGQGCTPWGGNLVFGTPTPLDSINSAHMDWKPFLPEDGLSIWFMSDRPGGSGLNDCYRATRISVTQPFGNVQVLSGANTEFQEYRLIFDSTGRTAFISTNRPGGLGGSDIWAAPLGSAFDLGSAVFSPVPNVNTDLPEWDMFLTNDDLQLFFNRNNQLYFAVRNDTQSPFQTPQPLGDDINLEGGGNPSLTADGLVLVFNSGRPGGMGEGDIWYATRSDTGQPFSNPQPVPGVNTAEIDADPFVSADGCTLYFARGPARPYDLYVAHIDK